MTSRPSALGRPLAVAALGMSALWVVLAFTTWRDIASGSRVGMPWTNYHYGQAMLFETGIQVLPLVVAFLWNCAAALIGYRWVIRPLFGDRQLAQPVWLLLAGHIPGTLLMIAAVRVATLLLPNSVAPTLLLLGGLVAALLAAYWSLAAARGDQLRLSWRLIWPGVAALLVALAFSVHLDRFHVMGEGSVWFITNVFLAKQHGLAASGTWPVISQHYDEAAFLYPVFYGLASPGDTANATLTALYWLLLAFSRLGAVSIAYVAIRALGVDRLSSLILLAFFCGASLSLNPVVSRLLFDSLSPLAYVLHVSRFLVPVLPLLLIAAVTAKADLSWRSACIAAMLGIGLSSMPVHAAIVLPWAFAVGILTFIAPEGARSRSVWLAAGAAALALMGVFTIAYGVQSLPALAKVTLLLGGGLVAAGTMLVAMWLERASTGKHRDNVVAAMGLLLAACGGYALGLLLLGNVLIPRSLPLLAEVWPWSRAAVIDRVESTLTMTNPSFVQSPYCDGGYYWGFRWLTGHCSSLAMFSRTYGLVPVVMTALLAWWLIRWPAAGTLPDRILTPWLVGIVVCFIAMPFGFVVYDFVSPVGVSLEAHNQLSIWLRSRLVEPWFYGGGLLTCALFLRLAAARERRVAQSAMMIAVALSALSPLALPAQLLANIAYLFDQARFP